MKDPDRPFYVLQHLLAHVFKGKIKSIAEVVAYRTRDGDAARCCYALQPSRYIDTIAEHIVTLDDDVTDIDTDAEFDAPAFRNAGVSFAHLALNVGGAGDGIYYARKLDQHAVASQLDDAPPVLGDLGVEQFPAMRGERGKR